MVLETHPVLLTEESQCVILKSTPNGSTYVRVVASGTAQNCQITEFQTFHLLVTSIDPTTGSPLESIRWTLSFTFDDQRISKPPPYSRPIAYHLASPKLFRRTKMRSNSGRGMSRKLAGSALFA